MKFLVQLENGEQVEVYSSSYPFVTSDGKLCFTDNPDKSGSHAMFKFWSHFYEVESDEEE